MYLALRKCKEKKYRTFSIFLCILGISIVVTVGNSTFNDFYGIRIVDTLRNHRTLARSFLFPIIIQVLYAIETYKTIEVILGIRENNIVCQL